MTLATVYYCSSRHLSFAGCSGKGQALVTETKLCAAFLETTLFKSTVDFRPTAFHSSVDRAPTSNSTLNHPIFTLYLLTTAQIPLSNHGFLRRDCLLIPLTPLMILKFASVECATFHVPTPNLAYPAHSYLLAALVGLSKPKASSTVVDAPSSRSTGILRPGLISTEALWFA